MEDSLAILDPVAARRVRHGPGGVLPWLVAACLAAAIGCAASHNEADRTALREDHEHCLQDARGDGGRLSYSGYQACMDALGWPALDRLPTSHPS